MFRRVNASSEKGFAANAARIGLLATCRVAANIMQFLRRRVAS
jgi:hypothetical protein